MDNASGGPHELNSSNFELPLPRGIPFYPSFEKIEQESSNKLRDLLRKESEKEMEETKKKETQNSCLGFINGANLKNFLTLFGFEVPSSDKNPFQKEK